MVKIKEESNELFFVQIKEPNEVRRDILETLKHIVETLQRFEKLKEIRHEKLEKIHKLRSLLKEADKMIVSLKIKLPQTNLKATIAKEAPTHTKKHHKKKKKIKAEEKAPKKEMTEIEKLEAELNAIESKLKGLT